MQRADALILVNPDGLYDPSANGYSHVAKIAAGARLSDVAKLTVLIVDRSEQRLHVFGEELARALGEGPKPACTLTPVPRLALDGMLFEVEAMAVLPA